jgi:hypothetical protein
VYGLGTGPKTDVLADLIAEHPGAEIHFVEDRVETLEGKKSFPTCPPIHSQALYEYTHSQQAVFIVSVRHTFKWSVTHLALHSVKHILFNTKRLCAELNSFLAFCNPYVGVLLNRSELAVCSLAPPLADRLARSA